MKKKTKLLLEETLNKAIAPPRKPSKSQLDSLLEEYHEPEKSAHLKAIETGYPATQNDATQITTLATQLPSYPATEETQELATQLPDEKNYRSRKLRKQKSVRLPVQKIQKWEMWCYLNKVDFQDAVERGLDWVTSQPVTHVLIDDLEDVGTDDDVLIFYHRWTGNRITQKDKDARETVRRFNDDICKIGVAISIYRAKNKINSFKYCIGAIEEAAETPLEDKDNYLRYLEKTLIEKKSASDNK